MSNPEERDTFVKYLIKISSYSPKLTNFKLRLSRKLAIKYIRKMLGASFDPFTYKFMDGLEFVDIFYRLNKYKMTRENQDIARDTYFE